MVGVPWHPQISPDPLTLSQPGGQIMPPKLLLAPPDSELGKKVITEELKPSVPYKFRRASASLYKQVLTCL